MKIIHITLHKLGEPPSSIKWTSSTQFALFLEYLVGTPPVNKMKNIRNSVIKLIPL